MRKTFLLGGVPFTAPDPIGAGIRARAAQITSDIADEKKVTNDAKAIITRYFYEYSLRLLELLLTPTDGSPSVREAYDSASDGEVQAITDFFSASATVKTSSASGKARSSQSSKGTAKQST